MRETVRSKESVEGVCSQTSQHRQLWPLLGGRNKDLFAESWRHKTTNANVKIAVLSPSNSGVTQEFLWGSGRFLGEEQRSSTDVSLVQLLQLWPSVALELPEQWSRPCVCHPLSNQHKVMSWMPPCFVIRSWIIGLVKKHHLCTSKLLPTDFI